jgi:hypothetical protein
MPSAFRFRIGVFFLAAVLSSYAVWVLAAEIIRLPPPLFPADGDAIADWDRVRAAVAARIGVFRGDLWADEAILLATGIRNEIARANAGPVPDELPAARTAAQVAARLAPHDSRMWLLVATVDARLDWLNRRVEAPLKMSYYTAPNDVALMALRLLIATHSEAISDLDLQLLVSAEIRTIVRNRPELKPAIAAAYRNALEPGRQFIEATLRDLDPEFFATIRLSAISR